MESVCVCVCVCIYIKDVYTCIWGRYDTTDFRLRWRGNSSVFTGEGTRTATWNLKMASTNRWLERFTSSPLMLLMNGIPNGSLHPASSSAAAAQASVVYTATFTPFILYLYNRAVRVAWKRNLSCYSVAIDLISFLQHVAEEINHGNTTFIVVSPTLFRLNHSVSLVRWKFWLHILSKINHQWVILTSEQQQQKLKLVDSTAISVMSNLIIVSSSPFQNMLKNAIDTLNRKAPENNVNGAAVLQCAPRHFSAFKRQVSATGYMW